VRPPSRLWQAIGVAGVVVLAIVVCLAMPGPGKRPQNLFKKPEKPPESPPEEQAHGVPSLPFALENGKAELGSPDAKVKVVAFIPGASGCGNETALFLKQVAEANKDKLQVEIVDFESQAGSEYQSDLGASCAGLMINGKQMIEITDDEGKKRTLDFTSNLGESYSENELLLGLDAEFEKAYGEKCKRIAPKPSQPPKPESQPANSATEEAQPAGQS